MTTCRLCTGPGLVAAHNDVLTGEWCRECAQQLHTAWVRTRRPCCMTSCDARPVLAVAAIRRLTAYLRAEAAHRRGAS